MEKSLNDIANEEKRINLKMGVNAVDMRLITATASVGLIVLH